MNKPVLVIMAAGMGSRFGGLKQITPVDEEGHLIIDYSIFDARRAGFEEVVIVVKPEMEEEFRKKVGDRIAPFMKVSYAHQRLDALPQGYQIPEGRQKPWGTAHAVLCAAEKIHGPFAVINADDFYGRQAFQVLYDFLAQPRSQGEQAMVSYLVENTLTENGSVSRGVCQVDEEGNLSSIIERTRIEPRPQGAAYTEDGENYTFIPAGTVVSLNFWGFQQAVLDQISSGFSAFLDKGLKENPMKCEYYLPSVPDKMIREGKGTVRVLRSDARWYGITYREDMPAIQQAIKDYKQQGEYPLMLWEK